MQHIIEITDGVPRHPLYRMNHPVNLAIASGEQVAIVGANGSGKSRLVDIITGRYPLLLNEVRYDFSPSPLKLVSENIKYITFRDSYGDSTAVTTTNNVGTNTTSTRRPRPPDKCWRRLSPQPKTLRGTAWTKRESDRCTSGARCCGTNFMRCSTSPPCWINISLPCPAESYGSSNSPKRCFPARGF